MKISTSYEVHQLNPALRVYRRYKPLYLTIVKEFYPPIQKRNTDELIIIANSSTDDWQQEGIDQAKEELRKRGVSNLEQKKRIKELQKQFENELKKELETRETEDYTILEKLYIVLIWPKRLLWDWGLKKEGYILKAKRRLQLISFGIGLYGLALLWGNHEWKISERKRIEEIDKVDISKWEKNRIPRTQVDTINKLDTITKK